MPRENSDYEEFLQFLQFLQFLHPVGDSDVHYTPKLHYCRLLLHLNLLIDKVSFSNKTALNYTKPTDSRLFALRAGTLAAKILDASVTFSSLCRRPLAEYVHFVFSSDMFN